MAKKKKSSNLGRILYFVALALGVVAICMLFVNAVATPDVKTALATVEGQKVTGLQVAFGHSEKEIEILEHQKQRLENRIEYLTKGDRAKRTHRLCEKGGAIESVCPETKDMTSADFYQLAEFIFDLPEVKKYLERLMP